MPMTIMLDAGHYGKYNRSPVVRDYYESEAMWKLHLFLKKELEAWGFAVKTTRKKQEKDMEVYQRGKAAKGCDLFLSLHSNAPGTATPPDRYHGVRGVNVYYSLTDEEGNAPLATALCECVAQIMQTPNRGIKTRAYPDKPDTDYYGVIRNSAQSGCRRAFLIEHGFHTNIEDSSFLRDDECLRRLAKGEADVIDAFFA